MKSLKHLNKYFIKYRWRFLLGLLFVTLSNLFAVYSPRLVRKGFDMVQTSHEAFLTSISASEKSELVSTFAKTALQLGLLYILLALIKGFFMFLMRQTLIVMSRHIEYDLKNEVYDHYQRLNLSFYKRNNTGDLMNRISEDVSRVRMYVGPAIMYSINLIVLFLLVIAAMISVNPKLTLFVLMPLPILSFAIYKVSSIINQKSDRVQAQLSRLSTFVQEAFSGIRVLKAYNREPFSANEFNRESELYKDLSMGLVRVNALFFPVMMVLIGLSTLITVYVGGMQAIAGQITIGNIAEFIIYVNMLTWPVTAVGWVTSLIQRAAASQERINEFLRIQPEIKNPSSEPFYIKGEIEFKNVSFTYPDSGIKALDNISFKIPPGETLAIVGKTGSGKSTIAALLTRQYDVTGGKILIDGKNIKEVNLNDLRSQTGYVPQEVFLFSDSIANNIAFGEKVDENNTSAIEQAAKDAAIYSNIIEFPKQFETMLGERGITLSGGQKQRVSIARAIIKAPQILLFDDCLSAVDTQTEEEILSRLEKIMKGKTSVLISHRVSTIRSADNILVLNQGKIIEEGSHEDLLKRKGFYCDLHQKQKLEDEKSQKADKPQ